MSVPKPEEPSEDDCCHNGCSPCVFDIYNQQMKQWERQCLPVARSDLLSQTCFKPFKLISIKRLTDTTNLYSFEAEADPGGKISVMPGQHLVLRLNDVMKPYTLLPSQSCFDVLIKLYPNGKMSNYVKHLIVGDTTLWRGPYGDFEHVPNRFDSIVMFCIGTGIAPMYSICLSIVANEEDDTVLTLLYGCRSVHEIILRDEMSSLSSYWNFNCTYYLSEPFNQNDKRYRENMIFGKISETDIERNLKQRKNCKILICGTDEFTKNVKATCDKFGILGENIHVF